LTTIGKPIARFEDAVLLSGAATYVADIHLEGCLDAVFVRSWAAHGTLGEVDMSSARNHPGVLEAFAAADLPGLPSTPAQPIPDIPPEMKRPALASGRVRFTGEAVAIVVAEDRAVAEDAAETALIEIEPLPVVLDPTEAAGADAVRLFDGVGNVALDRSIGEPVADDFAAAPVVIELPFRHPRLAHVSIEPRAFLVRPADDGITVWCSHQAPHRLRDALVRAFGLDVESVRVIVPSVGGAFGGKSQIYPEYIVATHVARMLGRPVRWIEDRRESFLSSANGRGQNQRLRLAADARGRILAAEVELDGDVGAYPQTGALVPTFTTLVLSGPYRIPKMSVRVRSVVTNAPPTAPYRGAGRPEAAMLLERAMDELARRVGLDPVEIRLRNFIQPEAFPYASPTGAVYDSGRHAEALSEALRLADYTSVRDEQRRRRESGNRNRLLGLGVASFVERTGGQNGSTEFARVDVTADGSIEARSGSSSIGQGHATAFAQVVASVFDIEPARVRVIEGDTAEVAAGTGSFGSRSMQVGGEALHTAASKVVAEALSTSPGHPQKRSRWHQSSSARGSWALNTPPKQPRHFRSGATSPSWKSTPRVAKSRSGSSLPWTTAASS
jgi:carbon-monoxide dehydrogenase large subunit